MLSVAVPWSARPRMDRLKVRSNWRSPCRVDGCETVVVSQAGTVSDLKIAAQQALGQRFLRLAAPDGRVLHLTEPLSGFRHGDSLTAIAQQPQIASTFNAFVFWCVGGDRIITWSNPDWTVVTWGHPNYGGDSSKVQDQLKNVQQVCGTVVGAFAAILADESVVTGGDIEYGGDSSRVQDQFQNV